jgi:hypothetical protein
MEVLLNFVSVSLLGINTFRKTTQMNFHIEATKTYIAAIQRSVLSDFLENVSALGKDLLTYDDLVVAKDAFLKKADAEAGVAFEGTSSTKTSTIAGNVSAVVAAAVPVELDPEIKKQTITAFADALKKNFEAEDGGEVTSMALITIHQDYVKATFPDKPSKSAKGKLASAQKKSITAFLKLLKTRPLTELNAERVDSCMTVFLSASNSKEGILNEDGSKMESTSTSTTKASGKGGLLSSKRTRKPRDPNAPPRHSAFNDYISKQMTLIKEEYADLEPRKCMSMAMTRWNKEKQEKERLRLCETGEVGSVTSE